jgi:hypothetical protein
MVELSKPELGTLTDRINSLLESKRDYNPYVHNVTDLEESQIRDWLSRVSGIPLKELDIWVSLVQDSYLMGGISPEGLQAVSIMTQKMEAGIPIEQLPIMQSPEIVF